MRSLLKKWGVFFVIGLFTLSMTPSCAVTVNKKDNGKHKGWFKNSNNPHHPNSTNPGHNKKKKKGKKKKKK